MKRENERVVEDAERERERAEGVRLAEIERKKLELRAIQEHEALQRKQVEEAERNRKEHAQRLEAIKLGELERARIDAQSRARLELERSQHEHERKMAEIRRSLTRSHERFAMIVGFVLLAASLIGGTVVYFTWLRPDWERARADYENRLAALQTKSAESERKLLLESRRASDLKREIEGLKSAKPTSEPKPSVKPGPRLPTKGAKKDGKRSCNKDSGDPLDGCIP